MKKGLYHSKHGREYERDTPEAPATNTVNSVLNPRIFCRIYSVRGSGCFPVTLNTSLETGEARFSFCIYSIILNGKRKEIYNIHTLWSSSKASTISSGIPSSSIFFLAYSGGTCT